MRTFKACCGFLVLWSIFSQNAVSEEPQTALTNKAPGKSVSFGARAAGDKIAWSVLNGKGFRIWYVDRELAERVLAQAEKSRAAIVNAWFPSESADEWQPQCDVYLCSSIREYAIEGRRAPNSAGQAMVVKDGHRVLRRKIVLKATDPRLLDAVVPHEVAHIITGSYFPGAEIPCWADEGIAMLNEPFERQQGYLDRVTELNRRSGGMCSSELIRQHASPHVRASEEFHVRSFGVAFYLVNKEGKDKFLRFVEMVNETDHATALQVIYGIDSFKRLDEHISRFFACLHGQMDIAAC